MVLLTFVGFFSFLGFCTQKVKRNLNTKTPLSVRPTVSLSPDCIACTVIVRRSKFGYGGAIHLAATC